MSIMVENSKKQTWRNMISQGMSFSEEDSSEYSFASIYTGPRPAYVPKAEPFGNFPLSSRVVVNSHQHRASSSPSQVVVDAQSSIVCESHESFVNEGSNEFPSGESTLAASVVTKQDPSPSQHEASFENRDAAQANLQAFHEMFTPFPLGSGESPLYGDQEDHISTHSEFSGRQFSSSHSSTNSSHELQGPTLPEPSPAVTHQMKKGQCFMCAKVNRMQEKETCLVCSAKYCGSCVLKAMGSMPEGRKCVECIGKSISESWRHDLGKPTGLLTRLLSTLEVQQIMKSEKDCPANQLRADQLYVNKKQLTPKEFAELLRCSNPPSTIKPGNYWYDAQCGYWGKEGEKPEKIITVQLKVGGELQERASAGCTKVYINNREITKVELKMLKFAGVPCAPDTRLWLYPDGAYQEEVQKHCPGKIWEKARVRLYCHLVGLPTPNVRAVAPEPSSRSVPAYLVPKITHKILLVGHPGCGTSTILKQAKFLYNEEEFTSKELQDMKALIQRNIYKYIVILLEARERFEEEENAKRRELGENAPSTSAQKEQGDSGQEWQSRQSNVYTMTATLKDQVEWFLKTNASGEFEKYYSAVIRDHASTIEALWKDPAIQATYKRRAELHMLPDVAGDFLSRVVEIFATHYTPKDHDILCAEGGTHDFGIAELQFHMDEDGATSGVYTENYDQLPANVWYHLIRISGTSILNTRKLLKMFDDIQAVIFCVGLDSYDQMWSDENTPLQNRMLLSRNLFETILMQPSFKDKPIILFLNKFDLFAQKLQTVPLTTCEWFADFHPVKSSSHAPQVMAEQAYMYVAYMFKKHFETVNPNGGKLHTFQVKGLDRPTVSSAFHYVKDILYWEEAKKRVVPLTSIYTSETSSFAVNYQSRR